MLLFFYLGSLTELHQLVKIPVLVEHYNEHLQKDKAISFWKFLSMHYAGHDHNDNDTERDHQLPFKSHESCVSPVIAAAFHDNQKTITFQKPVDELKHYSQLAVQFSTTGALDSIWQPPKA